MCESRIAGKLCTGDRIHKLSSEIMVCNACFSYSEGSRIISERHVIPRFLAVQPLVGPEPGHASEKIPPTHRFWAS